MFTDTSQSDVFMGFRYIGADGLSEVNTGDLQQKLGWGHSILWDYVDRPTATLHQEANTTSLLTPNSPAAQRQWLLHINQSTYGQIML